MPPKPHGEHEHHGKHHPEGPGGPGHPAPAGHHPPHPSDDEDERDPAMKKAVTEAGHAWRDQHKLPVGCELTHDQKIELKRVRAEARKAFREAKK